MSKTANPVQPFYKILGGKIELMRENLGWTQTDLAKRAGLSRASIANIEAGNQRILVHDIETLATAFQSTPKHLLRGIWW